jgi:NodT family efflux transporter outer membrane factor (OMF) lipoprotein
MTMAFSTIGWRRTLPTLGLAGLAGLTGTACMVGPDYKRPTAPVPPAYREAAPPPLAGAQEWKPAEPNDTGQRGDWWKVFQDAQLDALEQQVSVSNQTLALAEAQLRGARAVARGARADLFPTIGVAPSISRGRNVSNGTAQSIGPITTTTYQLVGDATYEVDVWGKIRRGLESSVGAAQASAADVETVRLSLHAELAVDYFLLRGVDTERQILASNVEEYTKALDLTVRRHDAGVVSGVDVAQAETQLETTRAQWTELGIQRAQLEHAIAILAGQPPSGVTVTVAELRVAPPEVPMELPSELLERRPDIAAAERRIASANAQIGVAQSAFFPSLLLNATGGWSGSTLSKFFSAPNLFWSLGAALAQTIFEGGKRIATKDQAIAAYDASVATYRETVLTSFQDVEDNLVALRILAEESEQQARAVAAARRAVEMAQSRYEGGVTTYLEVVTAQAAALASERTAVDLSTRRMTSSVGLIKALGGGWNAQELPSPGEILSRQPIDEAASAKAAPAASSSSTSN